MPPRQSIPLSKRDNELLKKRAMAQGMSVAAYGQRLLERALHQDTLEARLQRKLDSIERDGITVKNLLKIMLLHVFDDENQGKEMFDQAYRNAVTEQADRDE